MSGLAIRTKNGQLNRVVIDTTSTNKLGGKINASIIDELKEIIVDRSGVTSLSGGVNLERIVLRSNNINGLSSINTITPTAVFPGISGFTNLKEFTLSADNSCGGQIHSLEHNNLLHTLDFHMDPIANRTGVDNTFNGNIPALSTMPSLSYADFSGNAFSGTLPALSTNRNLEEFYCSEVNGTPGTGSHASLTMSLCGTSIPALSGCDKLRIIQLAKLRLKGRLQPLSSTPELEVFDVFRNCLSGTASHLSLSSCLNLKELDLNHNGLSGNVPFVNNLTKVEKLNFNNNEFEGAFPEITNCISLKALRFNANGEITGAIPDLSGCPSLQTLDMAGNKLTHWNGTVWPSIQFKNIQVQSNLLPQSEVDRILAAINATGQSGGSGYLINLAGTGNAAPTNGNSNADKVALEDRNWNVDVNT